MMVQQASSEGDETQTLKDKLKKSTEKAQASEKKLKVTLCLLASVLSLCAPRAHTQGPLGTRVCVREGSSSFHLCAMCGQD